MPISEVKCKECGKKFYGTSRAKFCSKACKQKDYYDRAKLNQTNETK